MTTEITIQNICPIIGMISSGKSSILNALFNIDYLEAKPQVTSKTVIIIKYNQFITKPRFYHLKLINEGNDNYTFLKENKSEIIGKEEIRKAIAKKNDELAEKTQPIYENIFYLLEIEEVKYIDKEFLKNNDLADIPGVSEKINQKSEKDTTKQISNSSEDDLSQTAEERIKNINIEKEINYLTQIFKILKNKIKNGIIVLSIDKFELKDNYTIILMLKRILNKPIENFLVLLNKMDLSTNIENDLTLLNVLLTEEFPKGEFNLTRNTIVQCSSFQIENELKMQKDFEHLLYFYYINYLMNRTRYSNFTDYLIKFITNFNKRETQNLNIDEFKTMIKSVTKDEESIIKIKKMNETIKEHHSNNIFLDEDLDSGKIDDNLQALRLDDDIFDLVEITNDAIIIFVLFV